MSVPSSKISVADAERAFDEWGANCGPGALAACLNMSLDDVRPIVAKVGFEGKRFMSPQMMRQAVEATGRKIESRRTPRVVIDLGTGAVDYKGYQFDYVPCDGIVRVQFSGSFLKPKVPKRVSYFHTHWIATRMEGMGVDPWIFDINVGWLSPNEWVKKVVPLLVENDKRRDGGWYFTHCWQLTQPSSPAVPEVK